MTRTVNIYALSRIHNEAAFNIVEKHQSQKDEQSKTQTHEMESLRILVDNLMQHEVSVGEMSGFFYGFQIPQIGKEFDLLRFTDSRCINIELKSQDVPRAQILKQLIKNRYYLAHLGKRMSMYTVLTDSLTCYKLSLDDELIEIDFEKIAIAVKETSDTYLPTIDEMFSASEYLVSPLNTPEKFIRGEYFLTQNQEEIKKSIVKDIEEEKLAAFFHISGKPGTGKTLLLYDIAKALSKNGQTIIIHCGKLSEGQRKINQEVSNLQIMAAGSLRYDSAVLTDANFILVDESHRIYVNQFATVCSSVESNNQICIFSSDPEQVLSNAEKRNDIVHKIKALKLSGEYTLSEKIRTNKELHSFIIRMKDLKRVPHTPMNYKNVSLYYANTVQEAQQLIEYFRNGGYTFINYSKSNVNFSPYSRYAEDYDTHHVIGQEFDKVLMLLDKSFYYDQDGLLQGITHPNPDYLYPNLFYQGITRVREAICLIVVDAPELFEKMISIIS